MNRPAPQETPHLLTVLHAAERTGPPIFALRWLRWLHRRRPDWRLTTLFLDGGEFTAPFEELGTVLAKPPVPQGGRSRLGTVAAEQAFRLQLRSLRPLHLAHVHCAGSMRVAPSLPPAPVLAHVHELSVGLDFHLNRTARQHLPLAQHYVAVSDAVRDELLRRFPIEAADVERQWGFVDTAALPDAASVGAARNELGSDRFVVVGSGVRHWRKAPELFVRAAVLARRHHPEVPWTFLWVGGEDGGAMERAAAEAGVGDVVRSMGHVEDPLRWIGAADVFLLSAREDAFPLVCVEAAALGRPIVTFDSGGAAELVAAAGCGRVVEFPDVEGIAGALHGLAVDPAGRSRSGAAAARFAAEHLTIDVAGPRLLRSVETTMGRS